MNDSAVFYVVVTRDRIGGYRCSLRDILPATRPMMQSARVDSASDAKREAERLFGALDWVTGSEARAQSYVIWVASVQARSVAFRLG